MDLVFIGLKAWLKERFMYYRQLIIEEDGKYFNRLVAMQKNGEYVFYDKRHLLVLQEKKSNTKLEIKNTIIVKRVEY